MSPCCSVGTPPPTSWSVGKGEMEADTTGNRPEGHWVKVGPWQEKDKRTPAYPPFVMTESEKDSSEDCKWGGN